MVPDIVSTDTLQFVQKPAMSGSNSSMSGSNSSMSPAASPGTNATSVSIVKGASNPSTQKPYYPSPLNVAVGRTVLWINSDNTAHTVTEGNPSGNTPSIGFDSGILGPGQTFKHAFDKAGTVSYAPSVHVWTSYSKVMDDAMTLFKAMASIIHVQNVQDMIRPEHSNNFN
jgi:plastocyanin